MIGRDTKRRARATMIISLAMIVMLTTILSSCENIHEKLIDRLNFGGAGSVPTAEEIKAHPRDYITAIEEAAKNGETKVRMNIVATEEELKNINFDFNTFWATPVSYVIEKEWEDVQVTPSAATVSVKSVEFTLELSEGYYVYHLYRGDRKVEPPENISAMVYEIYEKLPGILNTIKSEIKDTENPGFDAALAAHDWLVTNVEYDEREEQASLSNSIYGALVKRNTMCQGYAEAFALILICLFDINVMVVPGEGKNADHGEWVNHAWNIANLDGKWYQVDVTFDDPVNSDSNVPSHIYFARNNTGMAQDHRWDTSYWANCDSNDFYYFREENLYAEGKKELKSIVKRLLKNGKPTEIEIAIEGAKMKSGDLEFIYYLHKSVSRIFYSFTEIGNVTVVNLKLEY